MRDPITLRDALASLTVIRQRMADTEVFRGYRALPVAFSAIVALLAGMGQHAWLPTPMQHVPAYVGWWSAVAFVSIVAAGVTMFLRDRVAGVSGTRALTWLAVQQFAPCLLGATAVTAVLMRVAPETAWLLPGLWQVFFSQGVWTACRLLPRPALVVPVYYFLTGIIVLAWSHGDAALSPWLMAFPFGVGQLLAAAVLYWTLERSDGHQETVC